MVKRKKFTILKSMQPGVKRKFLIFKNGKIIGRTDDITLDLRPIPKKRRLRR